MSKSDFVLSIIICVLMISAACGGLLFPDLYRESSAGYEVWSRAYWFGNDLVTLILAVPLLITALIFATRGSLRARLIWLGMMHYVMYNYAFYLFGASLNRFFPMYVALFTLSILVLISALFNIDVNSISRNFHFTRQIKWVSCYMFFFAACLLVTWSTKWISFVSAGMQVAEKGDFIRSVAAVDISLLGSGLIIGGAILWKRKPWGYILATILNMSVTIYMIVLTVVSFSGKIAGIKEAASEIPIWTFLTIASLLSSLILLKNVQYSSDPYIYPEISE